MSESNGREQSTQYSLAAIFYFVTLMSLVFSAAAPFLRAITAKNRIAVLTYGSIQMGLIGVIVFGFMLSRARVRTMVRRGSLLHRTSFADQGPVGFWQSLKAIVATIPAFFFLLFAGAAIAAEPLAVVAFLHPVFFGFQVAALYYAVRASLSLYYEVDHRDLEVFQTGYVHGGYTFYPWEKTETVRPAVHDDSAVMVVERFVAKHNRHPNEKTFTTKKLRLRPDRRDEVVRVMMEQLAKQPKN